MKFELSLQRTRQVHVSDIICSSYFCGYALRLYCKDIRAIDSHGLLQLCNNLDLAVREEIAFPITTSSISYHAKSYEIRPEAKHSNFYLYARWSEIRHIIIRSLQQLGRVFRFSETHLSERNVDKGGTAGLHCPPWSVRPFRQRTPHGDRTAGRPHPASQDKDSGSQTDTLTTLKPTDMIETTILFVCLYAGYLLVRKPGDRFFHDNL